MVRREDIPWEELQRLNAQGWSYRRLAEKYGVSSSAIGRRAVLEGWHGTNDQRANARLRNLAARLRRQAEQRLAEDLDTRDACRKVRHCVATCLTDRERSIITLRYGLDDRPPRTQREIASRCGISRSYV